MNTLIWIASYPKSGNTWFRTLISYYTGEEKNNDTISINSLLTNGIFSGRELFDRITGIESSELTYEEIDYLRPEVYEHIIEKAKKNLFIKVHDAFTYLPDGRALIPSKKAKAIYLLRNPLDVAVSFSFHQFQSIEKIIEAMKDEDFGFCKKPNRLSNQLRQKLLSWSSHVMSWVEAEGMDVYVVRYEDLKKDTVSVFSEAVRFMGLDFNIERIKYAVESSSFERLKRQEEEQGFKEKPGKMNKFFREGKVGGWRKHLTDGQMKRILSDHGIVMRRFGYIDRKGKPVY